MIMENHDLFSKEIILENERALLEPLSEKHFELLWPIAAQEILWKYTTTKILSEKDFTDYFYTALAEKANEVAYPFAIFDRQQNRYAGSTRFGNISLENKRAEIGWTWYHPDLQRTGLNRNCKFLLLTYAFETLGLQRVEFKTSLKNLQSQEAILKIGATKEGIFRKHLVNADGTTRDTVYFSIIDDECPAIKNTVVNSY